ncbi:hypothetical protein BS628_02305 [Agrobacterium radiobacter]|nr:hypothetical protein L902_33180 [Agrobacterium radiobacter DSM 30147]KWT80658.1 hypothetical protein ASH09_05315 [Agrobacterium radiobacter]OOO38866.1 hypothetical protein BS628_02305 [Agrobacterium radiobacter]OVE92345.1 hypothetical protein B7W89_08265 [Agrobacterium tumefaciens]TGE80122.1 hypothetical protein C9410_07490 [Rhizobium sp. SEMIA 439]
MQPPHIRAVQFQTLEDIIARNDDRVLEDRTTWQIVYPTAPTGRRRWRWIATAATRRNAIDTISGELLKAPCSHGRANDILRTC